MNLQKLKEAAQAATPGPRSSEAYNEDRYYSEQEVTDCGYNALCDPQTILKLVAIAEAAKAVADVSSQYELGGLIRKLSKALEGVT